MAPSSPRADQRSNHQPPKPSAANAAPAARTMSAEKQPRGLQERGASASGANLKYFSARSLLLCHSSATSWISSLSLGRRGAQLRKILQWEMKLLGDHLQLYLTV